MSDQDGESAEYAPADTLLGLVERGRGAGRLWAREDPEAGAAAVLECLRRETRYDRQCDARHDYHAQLVRELGLPIDLLRQQAEGEDEYERAREALAALALSGSVEAREVLRRAVRRGPWWQDVLDTVADRWPVPWWDDLAEDALRRLGGAEPEYPDSEPWLRWRESRPARPRRAAVRHVEALAPSNARLLAVLADGGSSRSERTAAVITLVGRPPLPELLPLVPELWTGEPAEPGERPLPQLLRAVDRLGPLAVEDARRWASGDRPWLAQFGASVLARHGELRDLPLLVGELERQWAAGEWCGPDRLADGVARFGPAAGEAVPVLRRFWEHTPHSYERPSYLRALAAIRPGAMGAEVTESLWDCEEDARLFAVEHAPEGAQLHRRLEELRGSAVESGEVRAAAGRRSGCGNR
ncbi:hypothetical protein [Kitasatospora sp. CB01950]|uniref:hypothetical protein n=1 Tax=Kitasatospora sp. CB01950 TaxID=1703930 RepID=UPI00093E80FF|nr:hypothetical protein [Kitasatospora sp. CB01950]OKJ09078.1 hypothetical protein AMK19_16805 [Kitasatospora sp. CB01950]